MSELDSDLGELYGEIINRFHRKYGINPDLIASHGHTVFHDPGNGITLQIGNGQVISSRTGIVVVNNFRQKDVENGGQGAPLVPVGDHLLFREYDICLNIGGIANLSYEKEQKRIAFDICPANMLLNDLAERIGWPFDRDGLIAKSGLCNQTLLGSMNRLDFYRQPAPKTLGREWIDKNIKPLFDRAGLSVQDALATATEHIAIQVASSLQRSGGSAVLVTGGGAKNKWLIDRIKSRSVAKIILPDDQLIDYKESLIFGLLGILRIRNEINCYASVTGASEDLCTGDICKP
jgi:anhydro-N-acetylmuramic acid kinase